MNSLDEYCKKDVELAEKLLSMRGVPATNLATVEVIKSVIHHPNADKLDIVRILGYDAIVGRDQYKEGDIVIFVQPDSILPNDAAWSQEYLRYTSKGRLRAVRLRGEWSMGLVLNYDELCDKWGILDPHAVEVEGDDVTALLGITKHEPKLPGNLQAKGGLPYGIPKTDEDRWQNIRDLDKWMGKPCHVTLKRDGSSATYYCVLPGHWPGVDEVKVGITSRSLELKLPSDTDQEVNSKWHEAESRYEILKNLRNYCELFGVSLALRGEITGAGIQAFPHNPHAQGPTDFALFDVYNITQKKYERLSEPHYYMTVASRTGLPTVETLEVGATLTPELIQRYDSELQQVNGRAFEGVVLKFLDGTFKIINKWYDSTKE